jgi:nitroreductase
LLHAASSLSVSDALLLSDALAADAGEPNAALLSIEAAVLLRHTIREYAADSSVPEAQLGRLLSLVRLAPSSGNMASYRVVIVRSQEIKSALADAAWGQDFLAAAPVLLVWLADEPHASSKYADRGAFYAQEDATIAASYVQLLAVSEGLATGWAGAFDEARVAALVGAQPGWRPIALMSVGVAAHSRERRHRRPLRVLASVIDADARLGDEVKRRPLEGYDGTCSHEEAYCEHPLSAQLREARAEREGPKEGEQERSQ